MLQMHETRGLVLIWFTPLQQLSRSWPRLLHYCRQVAVFILILILGYSLGTAWLELGAMRGCAAPLGFGLGHTMLEPRQQGSCHCWITVRTYYNILEQDPILPERCRASKCSSSGQLSFALQRCAVQERDGKKVCGRMIYAHFPRFPDLDDAWHMRGKEL